uniref:SH2 domain-containing protein n=1 Tax=Nothobranchius furzeri TaxID=105023 RepID=A0A8C6KED0_NOTFU
MEPEYDVVDDQEEVLRVHILPARPIIEDQAYADRDCLRPYPNQSVSSVSTRRTPPRCPTQEVRVPVTGPAINRELKPGRRKTKLDRRPTPAETKEHASQRCSPFTSELPNKFSGFALQEPCSNDKEPKSCEKQSISLPRTGPQTPTRKASGPLAHQRHSMDLETHDLDKRVHHNLERVPSRRHHHEWPQTQEDMDQLELLPVEKPKTYCKEDWYIGACIRTDAEHALHLVNKDGAFLVRDCSINTNSEPLVLVVYHEKKVYNVKIRFIEATQKYALGTGQRSKDLFDSVAEIIKFHSIFPITLISGRNTLTNKYPENCVLTCPITKKDLDQLLA